MNNQLIYFDLFLFKKDEARRMWWLRVSFQNRDAITIKQLQQQQNLFLVVNGNVHKNTVIVRQP